MHVVSVVLRQGLGGYHVIAPIRTNRENLWVKTDSNFINYCT